MTSARSTLVRDKHLHAIYELIEKQKLIEQLAHYESTGERQYLVNSLVHRQHLAEIKRRLEALHTADLANLLDLLPQQERKIVWQEIQPNRIGDVLVEVDEPTRQSLIDSMTEPELFQCVELLDADDLSFVAQDIPKPMLQQRMQTLTQEDQHWVNSSLTYNDDTAGALMSCEMLVVRATDSIAMVLEYLRQQTEMPSHSDKLFVVDQRGVLSGIISLHKIVLSDVEQTVESLLSTKYVAFNPEDNLDDVATAFERYDLVSSPVVNDRGKLLGRLTVDLVMDYIRDSTTEDVLLFAGMKEEDVFASAYSSAKNRWPWLMVNLIAALIASRVIGAFEQTITGLVALAAIMPIIASIGGNTGNQTIALMIRRITLGKINQEILPHLIKKELATSMINGVLLGGVVGVFSYIVYANMALSLVVMVAMVLNLLVAVVIGLATPITLNAMGKDPALGSSILLTATTDSLGFFIFLGLASVFII